MVLIVVANVVNVMILMMVKWNLGLLLLLMLLLSVGIDGWVGKMGGVIAVGFALVGLGWCWLLISCL